MAPSFAELAKMSDEELRRRHDEAAKHTVIGVLEPYVGDFVRDRRLEVVDRGGLTNLAVRRRARRVELDPPQTEAAA